MRNYGPVQKYLYLAEPDWAGTWVKGGEVPLYVASRYLGAERYRTTTPDENLIHKSEFPVSELKNFGIGVASGKNLTIVGNTYNGLRQPDLVNADYYREDGLVLCLCNSFAIEIGLRLGKRACVRILDVKKLKKAIDKQLGRRGLVNSCEYTATHNRNHFLKGLADSWQDEFRIFWPNAAERTVQIPQGLAELVEVFREPS